MALCSVDLTFSNLVLAVALFFLLKKVLALWQRWNVVKMLERHDNSPRDKVLLHLGQRCKTMPSISPYVMKLETYLRMAKIPYGMEFQDMMGPKGKTPWISYNRFHIADSQLCVEFLNKTFGVNLNSGQPEAALAAARACRVVLEEHFFWGIVQYRWIENPLKVSKLFNFPKFFLFTMLPWFSYMLKSRMDALGIGSHTPAEIYELTEEDLRMTAKVLGDKKFMCGDSPCQEDCGVFGCVSMAVWGMPGSSFENLVNGELTSLKRYCERMKELYWPDWEECLDKSN